MNRHLSFSHSVFSFLAAALFLICVLWSTEASADAGGAVKWQPWRDSVFEEANKEKKLVILNLEAVWCHWCHVMDEKTYSQESVASAIAKNFIPLRVDQDARPDLSTRYRDYGWPATIFFNSSGVELAKRAGYIEADEMTSLLSRLVENPNSPEEKPADPVPIIARGGLDADTRAKLLSKHRNAIDPKLGGLKLSHRFLDADYAEYALSRIDRGIREDEANLRLTLSANKKLLDPVWGGMYQYSTYGDWDHPHFEKIMSTQANNLRIYSLAALSLNDPTLLDVAAKIRSYGKVFLTDANGAFYTSQDADLKRGEHSSEYFQLSDAERRALGIPRIDTHQYSRENGWLIGALASYAGASGDSGVIDEAERAARWVLANRQLKSPDGVPTGGFRHDEVDSAGPYLGDTLAMGSAALRLYEVTAKREWLDVARGAAEFVVAKFRDSSGEPGLYSAVLDGKSPLKPIRHVDDNIHGARFLNLAGRYLGKEELVSAARDVMRYLASPAVAMDRIVESGVLLVDEELASEPLHLTILGGKGDPKAQDLFVAAQKIPSTYKRLEWWDKVEGPLPNPDVNYPQLPRAAAFLCTNKRCSLPIFAPGDIKKTMELFARQKT